MPRKDFDTIMEALERIRDDEGMSPRMKRRQLRTLRDEMEIALEDLEEEI